MIMHAHCHMRLLAQKVLFWISLKLIQIGSKLGKGLFPHHAISGLNIPRIRMEVTTIDDKADVDANVDFPGSTLPRHLTKEELRRYSAYVTERSIEKLATWYWKIVLDKDIKLNYT